MSEKMGLFKVPCLTMKYKKIIGITATLLALSNPTLSFAEDSAQINLRDVEIPTLIETVSRITGKSFVVADSCTGSFVLLLLAAVIITFPASLREKLIGLLRNILLKQGSIQSIGIILNGG